MTRLPEQLTFLRPVIHRLRMNLRQYSFFRFLYGKFQHDVDQSWLPAVDGIREQFLNLLDRLAVLESSLNWRLYGLPARIENISLEQLPVLAGAGVVQQALACLAEGVVVPRDLLQHACKNVPHAATIFLVAGENLDIMRLLQVKEPAKVFTVVDPHDLFSKAGHEPGVDSKDPSVQFVVAPLLDAAARFTRPEFDFIWLSSAIERLTPVQIQALFLSVKKGISQGGRCSGFFADFTRSDPGIYWADPRRLRPLTPAVIKKYASSAGFNNVLFTEFSADPAVMQVLFEIS